MTYAGLSDLLLGATMPVLLLEGTRELPVHQAPLLTGLAAHLARAFPHARFRTGNAKGSDAAFAAGVASVDAGRLEFVLPYASHRRRERPVDSPAIAMDDVPSARVQELVDTTLAVSPQYQRVAVNYREHKTHPRQRASAQLILRDTLKVIGTDTLRPPVAGIFYVHAADSGRGGTGHTMRVCRALGVPVINQFEWRKWAFELQCQRRLRAVSSGLIRRFFDAKIAAGTCADHLDRSMKRPPSTERDPRARNVDAMALTFQTFA